MTKSLRPIVFGVIALSFSFSSVYLVSLTLVEQRAQERQQRFFAKEKRTTSNTSLSEIATRRVCSSALSRRGSYVFDVNYEDVEVRLFASNTSAPQIITPAPTMLRDLMNDGRLKLDLTQVADGDYQLLLCHKKHDCQLPKTWKNETQLQALLQKYQNELRREFERQQRIGFRHYSLSFAEDSRAFAQLRDELLTESRGILGGVPQISVHAGSIVQPRQSLSVRPHRITTRTPTSQNHIDPWPVEPQFIVAWKMEDSYSGRQLAQAPSPDGCDETASFLTVDLQGHGLHVGSVLDGQYRDLYRDGSLQRVAWPQGPHTAFIAWRHLDTGAVTPISQLMALRVLDSDGNGQLNLQDRLPEQLGLWQDLDQNGTLSEGEWRSFAQAIATIDLNGTRTYVEDYAGNRVEAQSRISLINGGPRMVTELYPRHF